MSVRDLDPLDNLLQEVQSQFEQQLRTEYLLDLSKKLQTQFREQLSSGPQSQCMLPSFNYELPTGKEQGKYLALEVGGSNLRMALVELNGRVPTIGRRAIAIERTMCFPINAGILRLKEYAFFDWMAEKIGEMLKDGEQAQLAGHTEPGVPLPMGVAWSFPIESVRPWD